MGNLTKNLIWVLLIFVALSGLYSLLSGGFSKREEISLSALAERVNKDEIAEITVVDSSLEIKTKDGKELQAEKEVESGITETLKNYGVADEKLRGVTIQVKSRGAFNLIVGIVLPIF